MRRNKVIVLAVLLAALSLPRAEATEPQQQTEPKPPYQRLLQGDDAKKAAALEKQIEQREEADQYAEAIQGAEELLALRRRVQGDDHHEAVNMKGQLEALRKVAPLPADQRAAWRAAVQGGRESQQLERQARYVQALLLHQKLLELRRKVLGEQHPDTADSYNSVAYNLNAQGQHAQAETLYRKALALRQQALGEAHPDTAESYNNVASNLDDQGKHAEAEPLHRKALDIEQKALGEEHPDTATSYNNLASNMDAQGKHAQAEPLLRKALAIRRQALGEVHRDTAVSYNNVAFNMDAQGKHAQAEPLLRKALAIWRQALGEDHPHTVFGYNNVAINLDDQGKHAEAEPLLRKALAIRQRTLGEAHADTAVSYNNVAANLDAQGKYAEAEPLYRKALAIWRQALGEANLHTALSCNNVAYNLHNQGKHAEAEPLYRKALAIRQQALGEVHPDTAVSYNNVAHNLGAQGKPTAAEPLYRKALAIWQQALGEAHPHTALSFSNVAGNLDDQGKHAEAEPLYRKALAIGRQTLGEAHPHTAARYYNVAANLNAQGKHAAALAEATAAARSYEAARLAVARIGLERAAFGARQSPLPLLTACLARAGLPGEAWRRLEQHLARGLLDDFAARATPTRRPEDLKRLQALQGRLAALDQQISAHLGRKDALEAGKERFAELSKQRQVVQDELAELDAKWAQDEMLPLGHIQAQLPADAALVAWVDFAAQPGAADPNGEHWACVVKPRGEPVWVRLPGSGPNRAWTKDDDTLPSRVRQALASPDVGQAFQPDAKPVRLESLTCSKQLYNQRLVPVEKHLDGVQRLIVLPAGWMAGVPVEALTDRATVSYAPSASIYAQFVATRGRNGKPATLLALGDPAFPPAAPAAVAKPAPPPPDHGLLITQVVPGGGAAQSGLRSGDVLLSYGNTKLTQRDDLKPAQDGDPVAVQVWRNGQMLALKLPPGRLGVGLSQQAAAEAIRSLREADAAIERSRSGKTYVSLPGTRREVVALARLFPASEVLLGSDASEQRLEQLARSGDLKKYRVLHFATHGEVDRASAARCALMLAQDRLPDPLVQAQKGLKVCDGRLEVGEILDGWQLDADLVTLSACETGLGQEGGGEGLMGFAQALLLKGARSLLVSLWKVDDTATALLMVRFYQNLLGQREAGTKLQAKAEALHEAKRWLRNLTADDVRKAVASLPEVTRGEVVQRRPGVPTASRPYEHPYYWSAFILIGDPN